MKYIIKAQVEVNGPVDKHDIIGAIFGQTEGLFGEDFDLRKLQDKGRIGRILVNVTRHGNKVVGEILIPSNLDRVETALVAAMIESVDRVGPYQARIRVVDIIDVRAEKIKRIVERAKEILKKWGREKTPDVREVIKEIAESLKTGELIEYGPDKLPAGPDVEKSDTIIIVEGRADVLNLLRYGYTNAIALEGARGVPETIKKLAKEKVAIAFVDGDRGGDLILRELLREADIDYVARAPPGKEVEDLTGREIARALANLIPVSKIRREILKAEAEKPKEIEKKEEKEKAEEKVEEEKKAEEKKENVIMIPKQVLEKLKGLQGTLEAVLYDEEWRPLKTVKVSALVDELRNTPNVKYVIMDGVITQRLLDTMSQVGAKLVIGSTLAKIQRRPKGVILLTRQYLTF